MGLRTMLQTTVSRLGLTPERARVASVAVGMEFDRVPDPAWQAMLDAASPPSDTRGRLVLVWDAGDRWQPIGRWAILQVQPWRFVDAHIKDILQGPFVRTDAQLTYRLANVRGFNEMRPRLDGPHINPYVDRLCHETFHRLKARGILGRPRRFWVVQGPDGGHPFHLDTSEEALWQQQGRTHYAPAERDADGRVRPGAAYAPFDARVIRAIRRYDLQSYAHDMGDATAFAVTSSVARVQALDAETNRLRWQKHADVAEELAPQFGHAMRQDGWQYQRRRPTGTTAEPVDLDQLREAYIHDFSLEAAR